MILQEYEYRFSTIANHFYRYPLKNSRKVQVTSISWANTAFAAARSHTDFCSVTKDIILVLLQNHRKQTISDYRRSKHLRWQTHLTPQLIDLALHGFLTATVSCKNTPRTLLPNAVFQGVQWQVIEEPEFKDATCETLSNEFTSIFWTLKNRSVANGFKFG